ncbi:protein LITTLE ZIPPER 1-like [Asparagus officinalis]|uniref:protein LITTLE ZIPPER 1-like n=1 Tax=Asparagus officinalis TaxID=4686 RepID=UPI00098DF5B2|nr:protein LITTLE ZIPPER 1-like [Asparagus officinalis]
MRFKNLRSSRYPASFLRGIPQKTKSSLLLDLVMKRRRDRRKFRGIKEFRSTKRTRVRGGLEMVNLKLYCENRSIMEENKRLREKALHLQEENRALLSRLRATAQATSERD